MKKISLQINLAPVDFPFARYILPHQLKVLGPYVGEIVLTIDLHKSKGRFSGAQWEENKEKLFDLIREVGSENKVVVSEVDYGSEWLNKVSNFFFYRKSFSPTQRQQRGPLLFLPVWSSSSPK